MKTFTEAIVKGHILKKDNNHIPSKEDVRTATFDKPLQYKDTNIYCKTLKGIILDSNLDIVYEMLIKILNDVKQINVKNIELSFLWASRIYINFFNTLHDGKDNFLYLMYSKVKKEWSYCKGENHITYKEFINELNDR